MDQVRIIIDLIINKKKGKFSVVYYGIWNGTPVALKKLNDENDLKEFESEAKLIK